MVTVGDVGEAYSARAQEYVELLGTLDKLAAALPSLLAELSRVLHPDGSLLLAFVDGDPGRSFPHAVITAYYWSIDSLRSQLGEAGLEVVEDHRRQDAGHRPHAALIARLKS